MINLKIPKKYLIRQYNDTAFGREGAFELNIEHFVFGLPGVEFDGYTFTAFSAFDIGRFGKITLHGDWYNVEILYDDTPITLKRTENREDGKRYKQYKFKPAELAGMYGCNLQQAVALVSIYANNGSRTAKEIIETKYVVGAIDGCWFICAELKERRRIDTKDVKILGYVSATDAQMVKDVIEQHKEKGCEIKRQLYAIQNKRREIERINDIVYHADMPELIEIYDITHKSFKALSAKYDELMRELDNLDADFSVSLGAYYIEKAA